VGTGGARFQAAPLPLGALATLVRSGVGFNAEARRVPMVCGLGGKARWSGVEDSGHETSLTDTMAPISNPQTRPRNWRQLLLLLGYQECKHRLINHNNLLTSS
jgi:hypothetical protein